MKHVLPPPQDHECLLPQTVYITPSNINPWRGSRPVDEFFTLAQLAVLPLYQLDPIECDFVVVRSSVTAREMWWPQGSKPPVYLCPCPIIGQRSERQQLYVISPAGMKKWVYADGSITRAGFALRNKARNGRSPYTKRGAA